MKISKLLVLTALWLVAGSVKAAVPEGVWTMPEPQGLEFTTFTDDGTHYYLYNPGAKMFFASGNSWNTQASARVYGYDFWLEAAKEEGAPEGSYELWNYVYNPQRTDVTGNHNVFWDGGSYWVDHGTQAGYTWNYYNVDGFVRFEMVTKPGFFIGWDGTYIDSDDESAKCSSVLKNLDPATEGVCVDWKAVTVESYEAFVASEGYEAYCAGAETYIASVGLKKALEDAEAAGLTCEGALAVYSNNASAKADLRAAKDLTNARITLKADIDAAKELFIDVTAAEAVLGDETKTVDEVNKAANSLKDLTAAKKSLKSTIDECKEKGFTETAAAEAVLQNPAATKSEVEKAEAELNAAFVEWGKNNASVANPADMTGKIKNPNFNNASSTGWSGTAPNMVGSGSHGPANVAEKWNGTFDTYQDIEGLPAGVYALSAQTMWRGSWNDMQNHIGPAAFLYAKSGDSEASVPFNYAYGPLNTESMAGDTPWGVGAGEQSHTDEETGVTYYIPNDPSCFRLYAEKGLYDTKVLFGFTEGTLRIGVKNPSLMGDADNWSVFDTFKLEYYGVGADAAQLYLDETKKNYSEMQLAEGTVYTEAYLTAYNESLTKDISADSFEGVAAAMAEIEGAKAALEKNIDLWKQWQAKVAEAEKDFVTNPDYDDLVSIGDLADYITFEAKDVILEEHALTNEELEAEIAKIEEMMKAVKDEFLSGEIKDGTDMTRYITNPGFEDGISKADNPSGIEGDYGTATGWTADKKASGNFTPGPLGTNLDDAMIAALGAPNHCFEAWHCHNFDLWQEVEDLPKGMYELNVQGYVRCEVSGYTRGDDINPDFPSPIYLYMNSAKAQFPSVYSECPADLGHEMVEVETWYKETVNEKDYPNSMGGAAQCFAWGMYKMSAYGLIAKKGDKFRIGVKMEANQDWWCIFDNFKLTYRKPTVEIVKPILEEELAKLDPNQGMGSEVIEGLTKVREDALAAIESGDAELMFDALVAVYDISDAISASIKRFEELSAANENLANAYLMAEVCAMSTIQEAKTLNETISDGIENHSYATEEVDGLLNEIAKMINRLGIPADAETASDENPVEFTTVIINPNYVDGDDHGWTGGASINASRVNAELFNKNFNYYQVLQGLPAGTYQVTLTGYYRAGTADVDYTTWIAAPEENNNALLYAVGEAADTCATPLKRLASEAQVFESLPDGYVWASEVNSLGVPNNMDAGGDAFVTENPATGKYFYADNRVTVKVGEEGKLTIGLKKDVHIETDWTLWSNWQLFYYGKNSALQPDIYVNAIKEIGSGDAVKVEFFNLNGARLNNAKKGIVIMKQTMSDGSVKIKKTVMK